MIDHRRIQRTLFRLQLDPRFAAAFLARGPAALASTGLGPAELALLAALDPAALSADRDGARRAQFVRNASAEFGLSCALSPGLADAFCGCDELHACVAAGGRLAEAFARHARRTARERDDARLAAVAELEGAMARARREPAPRPAPARGEVALAPRASVVALPAGTFALAAHVRERLDHGLEPSRDLPALGPGQEHVLILAGDAVRHRLREVAVEPLEPPVAALLCAAREPLGAARRERFAVAHGVELEAVEAFARTLLAEGVLVGSLGTG